MKIKKVTAEKIKERYRYDPDTGLFYHRPKPGLTKYERGFNTKFAGKETGEEYIEDNNAKTLMRYVRLRFNGTVFRAHRAAFLYMTGDCPIEVDHIDGDGTNNRWDNLRPATRQENLANRRGWSKTGFKGVFVSGRRFSAQIVRNNQHFYLGTHDTAELAHAAYCAAAIKHHGEFARNGSIDQ